jgi:hypothetical protein
VGARTTKTDHLPARSKPASPALKRVYVRYPTPCGDYLLSDPAAALAEPAQLRRRGPECVRADSLAPIPCTATRPIEIRARYKKSRLKLNRQSFSHQVVARRDVPISSVGEHAQ